MGGCNVVAILSMAVMVCLEVVSQARPFPRSPDRFQYAARGGKKFDVWDLQFHFGFMTILSSSACRY